MRHGPGPELRAEMGFLNPPVPPVEKYIDLSYYDGAMKRLAR